MSYTFSTSNGFATDTNISLINSDIVAQITTTLTSITAIGDSLSIVFVTVLDDTDTATLDNIISTRDNYQYPIISPAYVNPNTNVITHDINNIPYTYFGNQTAEIIISQGTQGQYTSILAAITANYTPNNIFIVYPGTYVENNPIILLPGTSLVAAGTAANTNIVAQNPGSDLILTAVGCKIYGFTLYSAKTPGSRGIYFDGSTSGGRGKFSVVEECFIYDCDIGVESDGKNVGGLGDTLYCDKLIIGSQTQSLTMGVYCHSNGQFISTTCYVFGIPGYFPITYGIYCETNAKVSLAAASVWFCAIGLLLDSGGVSESILLTLTANETGVYIGPNSPDTRVSANSLVITESITYDIDAEATSANIEIYSSVLDDTKIHNPNNLGMNIKYNSYKFGSYYQAILGDLQIGSVSNPSKLSVGGGLFIDNDVSIFSNSNLETGTWVDETNSAFSLTPPPFNLLQGTAPDNCIYFGSNSCMYGFKISISIATSGIAQLGDVAWEYWNGTTWISFNIMQTYTDAPSYTYMNCFLSVASIFHIRFGLTSATPFVSKTLNSASRNWVRMRVVNALASIPEAGYIKLHATTSVINNDGFTEYFGNGRIVKTLSMGYNTHPSNSSPSNQELFLASNLSVSKLNNTFVAGQLTRLGFCAYLPIDVDISFPIKINLAIVCDSSTVGNIYWTLRYCITQNTNNVYLNNTDAPTDAPNAITVNKTTTLSANQNNMDIRDTILIDVHTYSTFPSDNNNSILWISLERDATVADTNDTYGGSVSLILLSPTYISWNNGGHILGF